MKSNEIVLWAGHGMNLINIRPLQKIAHIIMKVYLLDYWQTGKKNPVKLSQADN